MSSLLVAVNFAPLWGVVWPFRAFFPLLPPPPPFPLFCSNRSRRFPPHDASLSPEAREDAKEFGHGASHRTSQANGEGRDMDFMSGPGNCLRRLDILDVARSPGMRT